MILLFEHSRKTTSKTISQKNSPQILKKIDI
nr:MAG TPA: hypothetical protein [Caudoviricetes sp.]